MTIEGVLPVHKPAGLTSHDVVAKARRILGMKRIGHAGTLDPQVTGVLPICLGRATRIVEYLQELPKQYVAELTIGYSTDTEDWTGRTVERAERVSLTEADIKRALSAFVGPIQQVPPMYSAVKVDGKKLYELARQGREVERKARTVHIYEIVPLRIDAEAALPKVRFQVRCSKGTYIRTLCVDIGRKLGYPAVMSALVRTSTGNIALDRCLRLEEIETLHREGRLLAHIIPTDEAIAHLPACSVPFREAVHAAQGKTVPLSAADLPAPDARAELVRLYDPDKRFVGVFRVDPDLRALRPEKVFA